MKLMMLVMFKVRNLTRYNFGMWTNPRLDYRNSRFGISASYRIWFNSVKMFNNPTHRVSVQSGKSAGTTVSDLWLQSTTLPRQEQADGHRWALSGDIPSSAVTPFTSATTRSSVRATFANQPIHDIILITAPVLLPAYKLKSHDLVFYSRLTRHWFSFPRQALPNCQSAWTVGKCHSAYLLAELLRRCRTNITNVAACSSLRCRFEVRW